MSLFLKIFLWFWIAMAAIVGGVMLVNWSTSSEPLVAQWQTFVGEAITNYADTSVQIFENENPAGVQQYFDRLTQRRRIQAIAFYDSTGKLIAGTEIKGAKNLLKKAAATGNPEFQRGNESTLAAKSAKGKDGSQYLYLVDLKRFQAPPFFTARLLFQILTVVLVGGLVCYALARYLTSPIQKLRSAAKEIAAGKFEQRVSEKIGKRKDELADLAKDFDEMAERIELLISSEKRLTQDISHELRSPLARMNVALELARSKSNADTLPMLGRLEREAQRLNELISQLLTLSKLETSSVEFERSDLNLAKVVADTVADADFEAAAIERGVVLKETADVTIFAHEVLIRSAVENVLRNASRYTPKDTKAEVTLRTESGKAILEIRDFGEGVPDDELEKLFKPFYRVATARDRKSGGIGLGLAIAESAVSNHGGAIFAKNTGNGLLVTIELPLKK